VDFELWQVQNSIYAALDITAYKRLFFSVTQSWKDTKQIDGNILRQFIFGFTRSICEG